MPQYDLSEKQINEALLGITGSKRLVNGSPQDTGVFFVLANDDTEQANVTFTDPVTGQVYTNYKIGKNAQYIGVCTSVTVTAGVISAKYLFEQ